MSRNLVSFGLQLLWLVAACDSGGLDSHRVQVPAGLFFKVDPPAEVIAGVAIHPAVVVTVLDGHAQPVTSARTRVTLALGNNPGGGTLSGTLTVAAVNGVARFSDLSLDMSGTYTLVAEATGLGRTTSAFFRVTFAPAKLVFQVQPSSAALGEAIGPPVVAIQDVQGNIVTTAAMSVTLGIETNPSGGALGGNTTAVV